LTEAEFLLLLRERKLTFVREANRDGYADLLSWAALKHMIECGQHPRGIVDFRVVKESVTIPPDRWLTKNKVDGTNKVDIVKIEEFLAQGFSLVITPIEKHVPMLETLCENLRSRLPERIKVGLIVTTGTGGAFKLHYDPEDLIILQLEGTKRWQIFGPAVSNPIIDMPRKPPPPEGAPIFDEVLQPGDFLFVPAGIWHHCQSGPDRSLHLGVFFVPPTGWHAVKALTSQLLAEELFRTPLTRFEGASELEATEADLKDRLIEKIHQFKFNEFLAGWNKKP
jgi:ribosomal protein L16 Arg81 hydroxylase